MSQHHDMHGKIEAVRRRLDRMTGQQQALVQEKTELIMSLEARQQYLDLQDEVITALNRLDENVQGKTRLLFEELLTELLHEVMPHKAAEVVKLTPVANKRSIGIDFNVLVDGALESVLKGKGGSVKNIIAMGLRFLVLARSSNRRFLVFDEADAWLRKDYIPAFAKVMAELSKRIGVQVIYISHHAAENFAGLARIIDLKSEGGLIRANILSDVDASYETNPDLGSDAEQLQGVGLRHIRLANTRLHQNTLIELSPNVTVICGDNDGGKSTVVYAIEALLNNACDETMIRRGAPEMKVEIGLESELSVVYTYRRKAKRRTSYELFDGAGTVLHEAHDGTDVPAWVVEYLSMPKVHGIDIHLHDQLNSLYLLDSHYSPAKRAEMLCLSSDAMTVRRMIALHQEKLTENRSAMRQENMALNRIKEKLERLSAIGNLGERYQEIFTRSQNILTREGRFADNERLITQLASNRHRIDMLRRVSQLRPTNKREPLLDATQESLLLTLATTQRQLGLLAPIMRHRQVSQRKPEALSSWIDLGISIARTRRQIIAGKMLDNLKPLPLRTFNDLTKTLELGSRLSSLRKLPLSQLSNKTPIAPRQVTAPVDEDLPARLSSLHKERDTQQAEMHCANVELAQCKDELHAIKHADNGHCPLCGAVPPMTGA